MLQRNHLHVFSLTLSCAQVHLALLSGDQLSDELLLTLKRHPFHRLIELHFLLIGHSLSNLIVLLLQLVSVLHSLRHDLLLSLVFVLFGLLGRHGVHDGAKDFSDLVDAAMGFLECTELHIHVS